MAIGKAGAKNAAIFALEILGITDKKIGAKIITHKRTMQQKIKKIKLKL
jgi:5-(carboxyamino)imidazole ribonucleotide mutase